jgi:small nuclear ribonucleoprotein
VTLFKTKILIRGSDTLPMKPLEVIHSSLEKRIVVQLRGNREYRGILEGYDHPHLNLILRNAEEFIEGEKRREMEKVIVRGDNIVYILA